MRRVFHAALPDQGSAAPLLSVPSFASVLTSAAGSFAGPVRTAHDAAPGFDGPAHGAAQPESRSGSGYAGVRGCTNA